jgi:hypothetical protein
MARGGGNRNEKKCETESGFIFAGSEAPLKWRGYGDELVIWTFCFCCKFILDVAFVINVLP